MDEHEVAYFKIVQQDDQIAAAAEEMLASMRIVADRDPAAWTPTHAMLARHFTRMLLARTLAEVTIKRYRAAHARAE